MNLYAREQFEISKYHEWLKNLIAFIYFVTAKINNARAIIMASLQYKVKTDQRLIEQIYGTVCGDMA